MNQREQVFEYLKEFGSITRMQAAGELGIFDSNRYGKRCRVTRYYAPTKWA